MKPTTAEVISAMQILAQPGRSSAERVAAHRVMDADRLAKKS